MESNACARLRWRPKVRPRNAVIIGLAGAPAEGCWARRGIVRTNARIAACEIFFIRSLEEMGARRIRDSAWMVRFAQRLRCKGIVMRQARSTVSRVAAAVQSSAQ